MLLLWLLGKFLHSATFATWVADYCHDLDQENGGLPLATWIFENLVMRDGRKTQAEAMQAKTDPPCSSPSLFPPPQHSSIPYF